MSSVPHALWEPRRAPDGTDRLGKHVSKQSGVSEYSTGIRGCDEVTVHFVGSDRGFSEVLFTGCKF